MKKKDVRRADDPPSAKDAKEVMDAVLEALENDPPTRNCAGDLLESLKRRTLEEQEDKKSV